MKFLKLVLMILPIVYFANTQAQSDKQDITNVDDIGDPSGTGTFPVGDSYSHPRRVNDTKQLEMDRQEQQEEEFDEEGDEVDSFGDNTFNKNTEDPDYFNEND